jgi:hypothetical protein
MWLRRAALCLASVWSHTTVGDKTCARTKLPPDHGNGRAPPPRPTHTTYSDATNTDACSTLSATHTCTQHCSSLPCACARRVSLIALHIVTSSSHYSRGRHARMFARTDSKAHAHESRDTVSLFWLVFPPEIGPADARRAPTRSPLNFHSETTMQQPTSDSPGPIVCTADNIRAIKRHIHEERISGATTLSTRRRRPCHQGHARHSQRSTPQAQPGSACNHRRLHNCVGAMQHTQSSSHCASATAS